MKLKPCPFCGGVAEICEITDDADDAGFSRYYVIGVKVECSSCGLLLPEYYKEGLREDDALAKVADAWNTRPAETALLARVREKIEGLSVIGHPDYICDFIDKDDALRAVDEVEKEVRG